MMLKTGWRLTSYSADVNYQKDTDCNAVTNVKSNQINAKINVMRAHKI